MQNQAAPEILWRIPKISLAHDLKEFSLDTSGNFEIKAISRYIFLFLIYGPQKNVQFILGQLIFKQF